MTKLAVCKEYEMPDGYVGRPGDFAFLNGRWRLENKRLKKRHVGCREWDAFEVEMRAYSMLGGLISADEAVFPTQGFSGATFRHLDLTTKLWSIYWFNSRDCVMTAPMQGGFKDGRGEFYADDTDGERAVLCRFIWTVKSPVLATWEQAFSTDGGKSWETNWTMTETRLGD